jgi:hypothetical protein
MFRLLTIRRGRKLAIALMYPLVADSRRKLPWLDGAAWSDPYVQGFIATAITLILARVSGKISSDRIGNVQTSTWRAITGLDGEVFGENVCLFSTERNPLFDDGCRNAMQFIRQLDHDDPAWPAYQHGPVPAHTQATLRRHWEQYFETYVQERLGTS